MSYGYMIGSLPVSTVQRLPSYLRVVRDMQQQGRGMVSSSRLAGMLGLEAVQVRKDFGFIGITGMPKSGYQVEELVLAMERCLCWNRVRDAVLVGVGHLGTALLGYRGFKAHGLRICAAFDLDPALAGQVVGGVSVLPMADLEAVLGRLQVPMAILTVAPEAAQEVALRLSGAGIEGIWNFTGRPLDLPPQVIVQDQDIATGLAVLSAKLSARAQAPPGPVREEVPV
jgi:redox-sensing transcriptional repressor